MSIRTLAVVILAVAGLYTIKFTTMVEGFKIGAFNIRSFGKKKADNPLIMSTIAKVCYVGSHCLRVYITIVKASR